MKSSKGVPKNYVGKNAIQIAVATFVIALFALFCVQSTAQATQDESSKDLEVTSIDWDLTDPTSSILSTTGASLQATSDQLISKDGSRVAMFRLYNKYTGEHFYTSSISEREKIKKVGWTYEGVGWYAPTSTKLDPVYRLYNPYVEGGDHHYTTNATERDNCKAKGWKYEGVAWYTPNANTSSDGDIVSVYRQYNPYATTGTHNYSTDKNEHNKLIKLGWKGEGVAWSGYAKLSASSQSLDFSKIAVTTTAKTYSGKAQTQTVKSSTYKLNTDYTVTYSNNKNAGKATILIEGIGAYTGSKTYRFTINKAPLTLTWGDKTAFTYNAKAQKPTASVSGVLNNDKVTVKVSGEQTNAGDTQYTATATIDNNNYQLKGDTTKEFTIGQLDISTATVVLGDSLTYNAEEQSQTISSVTFSGIALSVSDYIIEDNKATNAGTHTLKVTGKGNFKGTVNKEFTINQAETTCEVPVGPVVKNGTSLSSIDIKAIEKQANVAGSLSWADAEAVLSDSGTNNCDAIFVPDNKNYKTINIKVPVEVGAYFVTVNTQDHGTKTHQKAIDERGKIALNDLDFGTSTGLTLQNWYNNAACYGDALNLETALFNDGDVIYANWVPTNNSEDGNLSYWIGPSYNYIAEGKNEQARTSSNDASATQQERCNYVAEEWNVLKSSAEIKKDIEVMNEEIKEGKTVNDEGTVLNEYEKIMKEDKYHLYTIYQGGENEGSYSKYSDNKGSASPLNKYAEFRIIEVGRHQLSDTVGNDGSTVTFMATHVLPTAYRIKGTSIYDSSNVGGWDASDIRENMNNGEIYNKFTSSFSSQVKPVLKQYGTGGATTNVSNGSYKFWLLSMSEIVDAGSPLSEGTQYAWCKDHNIGHDNKEVGVLSNFNTRANALPGFYVGSPDISCYWSLRTPSANDSQEYYKVDCSGRSTYYDYYSMGCWGIVPAFCF